MSSNSKADLVEQLLGRGVDPALTNFDDFTELDPATSIVGRVLRWSLLCAFAIGTSYAQGTGTAITNDDAAALHAAAITSEYRLTTIKTECLYFDTVDKKSNYLVRVREKHRKECGGDPETSNTVFFMKLRKRDGHATTTAYNNEGKFQELRPVAAGKQP